MASDKDALCVNDPNFAVICAFMQRFSSICGIEFPNIQDLQNMLENTEEVAPELLDLHAKLLRRSRLVVHIDKWEKSLIKFCHFYSRQDAWEIERFGYKNAQLSAKIRALKVLLESQFDNNVKFKNVVNAVPANELRSQPLGKDKFGNVYWTLLDDKCNMKVFQEHLDEETFKLVASNRDELVRLISRLKGNEPVLPSLEGLVDEDSSSNSLPNKTDTISSEKNNEIQISQNSNSSNSPSENIEKNVVVEVKPAIIESKTNVEELDEEEDDEEEDDEEGDDDDDDDDEDEDESDDDEEEENIQDNRKDRPYTNKIILKPIKEPPKEELKIIRPSLISSKQPSKKPERNEHNKLKRDESEEDDEIENLSKRSKIERPTLLVKGNALKTGKYEDLDDEDDYDDEEEIDEEEEEEEENDEEDDDDDEEEYSDEIEDPVVHVKGLGSGQANQGTFQDMLKNNCESEYSEIVEENVMYIFGEGAGEECNIGNPEKPISESSKSSKSDKPVFFFGQPGCLKLSPIKSQGSAEKPSESQTATTSSTKSLNLVNYDIESSSSNSGDPTKDDNESDKIENVSQSFQKYFNENCTKSNSDLSIEINENKITIIKEESNITNIESQESKEPSIDNKIVPASLLTSTIDLDLAKSKNTKDEIKENVSSMTDLKDVPDFVETPVDIVSIEDKNISDKDEDTICVNPPLSASDNIECKEDQKLNVVLKNKSSIPIETLLEEQKSEVNISDANLDVTKILESSQSLIEDSKELTPVTNEEKIIDKEEISTNTEEIPKENEITETSNDIDNNKKCEVSENKECKDADKEIIDDSISLDKCSLDSNKSENLLPEVIEKLEDKNDEILTKTEVFENESILTETTKDNQGEVKISNIDDKNICASLISNLPINIDSQIENKEIINNDSILEKNIETSSDTNNEFEVETNKLSEGSSEIVNLKSPIDVDLDRTEEITEEDNTTFSENRENDTIFNEILINKNDDDQSVEIKEDAIHETAIDDNKAPSTSDDLIIEKSSNHTPEEIEPQNLNNAVEINEESLVQDTNPKISIDINESVGDFIAQNKDEISINEIPEVTSNLNESLKDEAIKQILVEKEIQKIESSENAEKEIIENMNASDEISNTNTESPKSVINLEDTKLDEKDNLNIAIDVGTVKDTTNEIKDTEERVESSPSREMFEEPKSDTVESSPSREMFEEPKSDIVEPSQSREMFEGPKSDTVESSPSKEIFEELKLDTVESSPSKEIFEEPKPDTVESTNIDQLILMSDNDDNCSNEKEESTGVTEQILDESDLNNVESTVAESENLETKSSNDSPKAESLTILDKSEDIIIDNKIILDSNNEDNLENIDSPEEFIDENSNNNNSDSSEMEKKDIVTEQHSSLESSNYESAESSNTNLENAIKLLVNDEIENKSEEKTTLEISSEIIAKQSNTESSESIDQLTIDNSEVAVSLISEVNTDVNEKEISPITIKNPMITETKDNTCNFENKDIPIEDNNSLTSEFDSDGYNMESQDIIENTTSNELTELTEKVNEPCDSSIFSEKDNNELKEEEDLTKDILTIEGSSISEFSSKTINLESDISNLNTKSTDESFDSKTNKIISDETLADNKIEMTETSYIQATNEIPENDFEKNNDNKHHEELSTENIISKTQNEISHYCVTDKVDAEETMKIEITAANIETAQCDEILVDAIEEKSDIIDTQKISSSINASDDENKNLENENPSLAIKEENVSELLEASAEFPELVQKEEEEEEEEEKTEIQFNEISDIVNSSETTESPISCVKDEKLSEIIIDSNTTELEDSKEKCENLVDANIGSLSEELVDDNSKPIKEDEEKEDKINDINLIENHPPIEKQTDLESSEKRIKTTVEEKIPNECDAVENKSLEKITIFNKDEVLTDPTLSEKTNVSLNQTNEEKQPILPPVDTSLSIQDTSLPVAEDNLDGSDISEIENFSDDDFEESKEELLSQTNIEQKLSIDETKEVDENLQKSNEDLPNDTSDTAESIESKISCVVESQELFKIQENTDIKIHEGDLSKDEPIENDTSSLTTVVEEKAEKSPIPLIEITKSDDPMIQEELNYEPNKLHAPNFIDDSCSLHVNKGDKFDSQFISREGISQKQGSVEEESVPQTADVCNVQPVEISTINDNLEEEIKEKEMADKQEILASDIPIEKEEFEKEIVPISDAQQDEIYKRVDSSISVEHDDLSKESVSSVSLEQEDLSKEEVHIYPIGQELEQIMPDQKEIETIIPIKPETVSSTPIQIETIPIIPIQQEILPPIHIQPELNPISSQQQDLVPLVVQPKEVSYPIEENKSIESFSSENISSKEIISNISTKENELIKESVITIPVQQNESPKEAIAVQKTKSRLEKIVQAIELKQMQQQTTVDVQCSNIVPKENRKRRFSEDEESGTLEMENIENPKKKIIGNAVKEKVQTHIIEDSKLLESLPVSSSSTRKRRLTEEQNISNDNSFTLRSDEKSGSDLINDVGGKRIKIRRHVNLELRKEIEYKRKLETETSSESDSELTYERSKPRLLSRSRPSSASLRIDSEITSPNFLNILDSEKRSLINEHIDKPLDLYNKVSDYSLPTLKHTNDSNIECSKIVNDSLQIIETIPTDINPQKALESPNKKPETESSQILEKNIEKPILSYPINLTVNDSLNEQDLKNELSKEPLPDNLDDMDIPSPESLTGYSDAAVSTISDEDDDESNDLEDLSMNNSGKVETMTEELSTKPLPETTILSNPISQPISISTSISVPKKDDSIISPTKNSILSDDLIMPSTSLDLEEKDPLEDIIPARTEIKEIVTTTLLGSIEEPLDAPMPRLTKESIIKQLPKVNKKPGRKAEPKPKVGFKGYKKLNETDNLDKVESEIVKKAETKNQTTPRKGRRGNRVLGLDIDTSIIVETETSETPVRQSRRIAQLKIKEEAERRKQEEIALQKLKEESEKKKLQKISPDEEGKRNEPSEPESESEASEVESVKKSGKKKRSKSSGKPSGWNESSAEESESEQEEEDDLDEREESDGGRSHLFKSDHEFSPESDIEDEAQAVPLKRARTVKKDPEDILEEDDNPDHACQTCGKHDHPEWILLCDNCDKGYHCSCLKPILFLIPEGDWFCPMCQHEKLIDSFNDYLSVFDDMLKAKEQEENRKKRLIYTNISMENVLSPKRDARKKSRSKSRSVKEHSSSDDDADSHKRRSKRVKDTREQYSDEEDDSSDSDAPIYKFRKRRQTVVSYRFNDYDDLINSAIKEEMDEVKGAGNLGRGKDISTIIEADKEEKMRQKELDSLSDKNDKNDDDIKMEDEEIKVEVKDNGPENIEDKKASSSDSDSEPIIRSHKKKSRKLTTLDVSSDEDNGSDEDFKESSPESEEEYSASSGSESSMELELKRRRARNRGETRRSTRERKNRFDREFINDDSEDTNADAPIRRIIKKKREDSDFSDFDDDDDEEEEDVDSNDLCDDTDSDSEASDGAWRPKKKKKANRKSQNRDISKRPPPPPSRKKPKKKEDDEKSFKAGITIKKTEIVENDEKSDGEVSRRTRGKKITYIEDYESSDDGIKPGVKRPDTPPEERERFIKKQEEIKRMLAAKNAETPIATKKIELPPLDVHISAPPLPDNIAEPVPDSISTVPLQVIQSAKALDLDFNRSKHTDSEFDNSLPEDFNPEDMDDEEIAKMMEEEDFAQQQLKLAGEVIRNKKLKEEKLKQGKPFSTEELKTVVTPPKPEPKKRKRKSKGELLPNDAIPKAENHMTPVIQTPLMATINPNIQLPSSAHGPISIPSNLHPSTGVQLNIPIIAGPSTSEFLTATNPVALSMQSLAPGHVQLHAPPSHLHPHSSPSHILPLHTGQGVIKSPYIPVMTNQEAIIPTTVLSVQPSPIIHTDNPQLAGINPAITETTPVKKRGRRKKITPLREDLHPPSSIDLSSMANSQLKAKLIAGDPKNNPILAERLVSSPDTNKLSIAAPPQLYTIGGGATPSVITRLPQPQRGSMPAPYGAQGSMPPRFYGPPQIRNPPMSVSPHLIRSPFGPNQTSPIGGSPSGSPSAAHYLPPDHRQSLPPPHGMYRQPTSMYGGHSFAPGPPSMHISLHDPGAPSHGIRGGPPPSSVAPTPIEYQGKDSGRQRLQPGGVLNKKFAGLVAPPYCAPQYGGYYSPPQQTGPPNQTAPYEQYNIKAGPPPPPTSHPDIIAAAAASTGGPTPPVAIPYAGPPPTDEERTSTSEFSGLVSYFSSQQDDLDT